MIPKATEDTITTLLKDELQSNGVKSELFPSVSTPNGTRKPDILCSNGGMYPLEAKYFEKDLITAIAKVQNEYLKYHSILNIKGGFAILYPEELSNPMPIDAVQTLARQLRFKLVAMFPDKDPRPFTVYEETLSKIGKIIAENVIAVPEKIQPSIDYMIKSLRDSALYILTGLKHLSDEDLVGFFGGKDVFRNILQYEESKFPVEELRVGAAYLLVNQLLFYQAIASVRPQLSTIEPDSISSASDLKQYFRKVLDINYKVIYSYDIASLIPSTYTEQVRTIISVIQGITPQKVGGDLLGTIFHDLIPFETRKTVAAFYTNVFAAELLASLSIEDSTAKIADFSVGSGGLLVAAYRRKKALLSREFAQEDHRRFVEEDLTGVDVMPFAANVAASHLALQSPQYLTDKVRIAIWDSTDLVPGKKIPSAAGMQRVLSGQMYIDTFGEDATSVKGTVGLSGRAEDLELFKADTVIMNPPFPRQERVPESYKGILRSRFKDYREHLHGQLSYYGYFILLADKFVTEGGRMALVIPATVLGGKSTLGIRKLWAENYHIECIVTLSKRFAFSEATIFRDILVVARKTRDYKESKTKLVILKKLPSTFEESRATSQRIRNAWADIDDETMQLKIKEYGSLQASLGNWFPYVALSDIGVADEVLSLIRHNKMIPLTSVGDATRSDLGHYKFGGHHGFVLANEGRAIRASDGWVVKSAGKRELIARNRGTGAEVKIPNSSIVPGIRRLSHTTTVDVSGRHDYITVGWSPQIKEMARLTLSHKEFSKFGPSVLQDWKKKFSLKSSCLLMSRRLYLSSPGTSVVSLYSERPTIGVNFWSIKGVEGDKAKILCLWLNSSINIFQLFSIGITREGSWMTLHDYMMDDVMVPDISAMNEKHRRALLEIFEEVRNTELPSILDQFMSHNHFREIVDSIWLDVLGFKGEKEEFLDRLRRSVSMELRNAKEMGGETSEE